MICTHCEDTDGERKRKKNWMVKREKKEGHCEKQLKALAVESEVFIHLVHSGSLKVVKEAALPMCEFSVFFLQEFILNQDWNDPKSQLQQCCLTLRTEGKEPDIPLYK